MNVIGSYVITDNIFNHIPEKHSIAPDCPSPLGGIRENLTAFLPATPRPLLHCPVLPVHSRVVLREFLPWSCSKDTTVSMSYLTFGYLSRSPFLCHLGFPMQIRVTRLLVIVPQEPIWSGFLQSILLAQGHISKRLLKDAQASCLAHFLVFLPVCVCLLWWQLLPSSGLVCAEAELIGWTLKWKVYSHFPGF